MSEQHAVMQLLAKNNIILDQDSITMIEDNNPDKEYSFDNYIKSKGFTMLHKLILISAKSKTGSAKSKTGSAKSKTGSAKYPKLSDVIKEYILLYPEEINKVNKNGLTALLLAVRIDVPEIVKLLVEHNANILHNILSIAQTDHRCNVNVKSNNGLTALMYASNNITESSLEIVKLLVDHNADVNIKSNTGRTALMYALDNNTESSLEIVKLLLEHNSDVNIKDNYGFTALIYALYNNIKSRLKIVKLLLEHNSDVNVKNNNGNTALIYALYNTTKSSPKIIKLLLEYDSMSRNEELNVVENIKVLNTKN